MNPRVSRSLGAGLEGDGFPIAKIAARLAVGYTLDEIPNDITRRTPAALRADDRLRGRQVAALRVREVPGRRRRAVDAHEVRRRGDGDRAHVPAGVRQGAALARAGQRRRPCEPTEELLDASSARRPTASTVLELLRRGVEPEEIHALTGIDPWFLRELRRSRRADGAGPRASAPTARSTPARPSSRPRRRTTTRPGSAARRRDEVAPRRQAERDHPRLGPEPDRPGHRVRLLLRARGDDRARVGPRRGDGQLQPGDGLDRLRHLGPAVLRAADARGRARRSSRSSSPRA